MEAVTSQPHTPTAIRTDLAAIFVLLELSRSTWLITSLSPGNGGMSKHSVAGGDVAALLHRFAHSPKRICDPYGNSSRLRPGVEEDARDHCEARGLRTDRDEGGNGRRRSL